MIEVKGCFKLAIIGIEMEIYLKNI